MRYQVYEQKNNCCGCGACQVVCPKNAIDMVEDEFGFLYPKINEKKCVNCGLCRKICSYKSPSKVYSDKNVYMSYSKNNDNLKNSSSGGVFFEIAKAIIDDGGIVYGCSMEKENGKLYPKHIRVDNEKNLFKLQGSKYVQSECYTIYNCVKNDLLDGKIVLFSGTPCQIEGLKAVLRHKNYDNLILMDIICHGVPSMKMFQDYIAYFETINKCKVIDYYFRDKEHGCGFNNKIIFKKSGIVGTIIKKSYENSYYQLFLDSVIYRDNCYTCPYATSTRNSDITIGDYWGAKEEHPDSNIDIRNGISCFISNTEKGNMILEKYGAQLYKIESTFDKVAKHNFQLNTPSKKTKEHDKVMNLYKNNGYEAVDDFYKKSRKIKNTLRKIRDSIKG